MIFDWVPGVSLYRRPADATFVINVGLAFGAGFLLNAYVVDGLPRARSVLPRRVAWLLPAATLLGGGAPRRLGARLCRALRPCRRLGAARSALPPRRSRRRPLHLPLRPLRPHSRWAAAILVVATAGELAWRNAASAVNAEPISTYSAYNGLYPDEARGLAVLRAELARREALGEHPASNSSASTAPGRTPPWC